MKTKKKPPWLKIHPYTNKEYLLLKEMVSDDHLHTVCQEARCPNIYECWGLHRTATFMILGDVCTRRCRFCAIKTGLPHMVDTREPERVAESIHKLELKHAVITMVDRDDLPDTGASVVIQTVKAIRRKNPQCSIELLTGDFMGIEKWIRMVVESQPDIMSHNIETVRRLTPQVRSRSDYDRSLNVLSYSRKVNTTVIIKSSIMLGLGESKEEVLATMDDLLAHEVQVLNIGQYLQPTAHQIPVQKYWHPDEFLEMKEIAYSKGFVYCESGTLIRSSYHAGMDYEALRKKIHPLYKNRKS